MKWAVSTDVLALAAAQHGAHKGIQSCEQRDECVLGRWGRKGCGLLTLKLSTSQPSSVTVTEAPKRNPKKYSWRFWKWMESSLLFMNFSLYTVAEAVIIQFVSFRL